MHTYKYTHARPKLASAEARRFQKTSADENRNATDYSHSKCRRRSFPLLMYPTDSATINLCPADFHSRIGCVHGTMTIAMEFLLLRQ